MAQSETGPMISVWGDKYIHDASIELDPWFEAVTDHEIDPGEITPDTDCEWDWDNHPDISEWLREYIGEDGFEKETGSDEVDWSERMRDNIYNNENDFSDCFTFTVYSPKSDEWYYGPAIIAVCFHRGGDPRNNMYDAPRLFYVENAAETGFLDWVMGWYLTTDEDSGDQIEDSDQFSVGYHSCPTSHLDDSLDPDPEWEHEWVKPENGHPYYRARMNGEWVRCYPDVRAEY